VYDSGENVLGSYQIEHIGVFIYFVKIELDPGESKILVFNVSNDIDINKLTVATKYKSIEKTF
jgi:hypothetical protein